MVVLSLKKKGNSIKELCEDYNIPLEAHNAISDVKGMVQVLEVIAKARNIDNIVKTLAEFSLNGEVLISRK